MLKHKRSQFPRKKLSRAVFFYMLFVFCEHISYPIKLRHSDLFERYNGVIFNLCSVLPCLACESKAITFRTLANSKIYLQIKNSISKRSRIAPPYFCRTRDLKTRFCIVYRSDVPEYVLPLLCPRQLPSKTNL